ncbi:MAG: hypothetical protein K6F54_11025 [Lachnospiraceae bacterium]|nr:hypothetical protein [Lachnospiraceae bacterium]
MSIASLTLSNYIMVAELMGLWVMLGSNVHLSKIGRLLRSDNGVPLSYVGMFVDITDQKTGQK